MSKKDTNSYGITSLVLGVVSIVFCWLPFLGLISGILGIIFHVQQKKISQNEISTGGLVTSIVGSVFSLFWTLFWIMVIAVI